MMNNKTKKHEHRNRFGCRNERRKIFYEADDQCVLRRLLRWNESVSQSASYISCRMSCLLFYNTRAREKERAKHEMLHVTKANIYHLMTMQSASDPFPFQIRTRQFHCLDTLYWVHRARTQRNDTFNFIVVNGADSSRLFSK